MAEEIDLLRETVMIPIKNLMTRQTDEGEPRKETMKIVKTGTSPKVVAKPEGADRADKKDNHHGTTDKIGALVTLKAEEEVEDPLLTAAATTKATTLQTGKVDEGTG